MADNKLTREIYLNYAKKIVSVLYGDEFFNQYKKRVEDGFSEFKLVKKRLIQDISIDWISTIEEVLPNLDTIVRNPRKFIVQEEDIVDISLCKAISTESVKHLAQHTNMISKVDKDGTVTPSRILNITKEESFEIYENRFIYTLLLKLKDFVQIRYDKIKKASATQDVLQLNVDSKFNLPSKKVTYRTEYMAQLSFDEVMRMDPETLEKIERIARIDKIITDFLASSFAKAMRNSAPVRPPITRTNVILKEPNFKKALTLWQFIETYQATAGFSTTDDIEDIKVETPQQTQLRQMVTLNTMLFESLYDQHETDMGMEDADFTDLLRVGDLDFSKDEIQHDEFSQKLDEDLKDEAELEEEVKPEESAEETIEEAKTEETAEAPQEETPQEEATEETPQIGDNVEEQPEEPEVEEQEVEVEEEVEKEVETPPREEQEDEEPDADEFDQHLFEVRKIYKRPEDDKLRQEEIAKIKDAIDRCLTAYRKIKQDELDEREKEEALKRRQEDLERRAEAFRQRRQELDRQDGQVYLGNDAFDKANVKAKTDKPKKDKKPLVNKNENLELTDSNVDNIRKDIELAEKEKAERDAKYRIAFAGDNNGDEERDAELSTADLEKQVESKKRTAKKPAEKPVDSGKPMDDIPERKGINLGKNSMSGTDIGSGLAGGFGDTGLAPRPKRKKSINPVDEGKVGVGDAPVKNASGDPNGTFEDQKANLGDLSKPNNSGKGKPRKAKAPETAPEKAEETKVDTPENVAQPENSEEVKPKIRKSSGPIDPWSLSPTTLNQKYDKPSGKNRTFAPVDENKVGVGNAPIRMKSANELLSTFGEETTSNKPVKKQEKEDDGQ